MRAAKPRSPKPKLRRTRSNCLKPSQPAGRVGSESCFVDSGKEIGRSVLDECRSETVGVPKLKLQLFPVDEGTRVGLEKDGFHPYLELTLSMRKRICSVLRHFNDKWSKPSIVRGEPVLFPYNASGDLASRCWTSSDSETSAGDVYAVIGTPSVFRLRYGWISNSETKNVQVPQTRSHSETPSQPDGVPGDIANINVAGSEGRKEKVCHELRLGTDGCVTDGILDNKPSCRIVNQSQGGEMSPDAVVGQSLAIWDDNLTNISIGGLLSEASLQGMFRNRNPKSNGNNSDLQPSQLVSDSFDAFIASQANYSQGPRSMPHGSSISILDAEDTCQPFSFQKLSSSCVNPVPMRANIQSGQLQEQSGKESRTDQSLCSELNNGESSLGLSGIKWTESLGPFDFGKSSSRKISGDDSLSLGRILS